MRDPELGRQLRRNPAWSAMPKRPQSYQSEATKAYTDEEMTSLVAAVRAEAEGGSVKARRDYALLLIYFFSGLRRREVISLRGKDVELGAGRTRGRRNGSSLPAKGRALSGQGTAGALGRQGAAILP